MPLIDPQTVNNPTAGAIAPASWGDAVRDGIVYLGTNKPRCRVYNSANISLTTATTTALTFNSERYDVGGCHSTSSNTSRLTVPTGEAGVYTIGGAVEFASNTTGERILAIRLNGTTDLARQRVDSAGGQVALTVFTDYALVAADYVELTAYQSSGGALNVLATGNFSPESWMRWVST